MHFTEDWRVVESFGFGAVSSHVHATRCLAELYRPHATGRPSIEAHPDGGIRQTPDSAVRTRPHLVADDHGQEPIAGTGRALAADTALGRADRRHASCIPTWLTSGRSGVEVVLG